LMELKRRGVEGIGNRRILCSLAREPAHIRLET
jgi:hypothetical protein